MFATERKNKLTKNSETVPVKPKEKIEKVEAIQPLPVKPERGQQK